jgi:hypothetical protein
MVEVRLLDYTKRKRRAMALLRLAPDGRVVMRATFRRGSKRIVQA